MGEFDCEPGCEFGGEGEQEPPAREPPHRGFAGGDGVVDTGFCVVGRVAGVDGRSQPPDFLGVDAWVLENRESLWPLQDLKRRIRPDPQEDFPGPAPPFE